MTDVPQVPSAPDPLPGDRLDSWKEIAAYLRRDVKTVQRWEKREAMPVHRHLHDKLGSVYAFRSELEAWSQHRRPAAAGDHAEVAPGSMPSRSWQSRWPWALVALGAVIVAAVLVWLREPASAASPLANAQFIQLTDFDGIEQAAAISRDGKLVAFLSDRDGQMDVWVTQVGSGEFHNLTRGAARDLINPSVRTLDFSPDGTLVTFWARRLDDSQQSEISVWGIPILGGSPRVYLDGAAEYAWSGDGAQVVHHTPGPGDPMFVRDTGGGATARQIFSAPAGLHSHFPIWSPDRAFIYFVQGTVADRMDIWRITPAGGTPERMTTHDAPLTYPVFLNPQTLLYLSTDADGSGPWIYGLDVDRRVSRRASFGIERYTSLAASADGRRLVATLVSPTGTLWRVPIGSEPARVADAREIMLTTGNGSSPRAGNGFVLYVSSKGTSDGIWKMQDGRATELWTSPGTRVVGGPALARDGRRIAFSTRRPDGQSLLWTVNTDGTDARTVTSSLELQGSPSWTPDGQALTVGAMTDGVPSLFNVPLDGRMPARLLTEHSIDPAWSLDGRVLVFSGADVGTTFPLKAVGVGGQLRQLPEMTLTRGARHVVFVDGGRSLVVMRGDISHKNLWAVDLETGAERQLTDFAPGFDIRDFDVTPDGRELVVEQVEEHSDIVLLDLAP